MSVKTTEEVILQEQTRLAEWVSQKLSEKSSQNFSTGMIGSQPLSQPSVEIAASPMLQSSTKQESPKVSSSSGDAELDLSEYATKEWVEEKLEDYVTKEDLDDRLEDYVTTEDLDDRLEDYATTEDLDDRLEDYATKEWVENALRSYPTWAEANSTYVDWRTFQDFPGSNGFANAVASVVQSNLGFTIQCNGDGTVTGYLTWGGLQQ